MVHYMVQPSIQWKCFLSLIRSNTFPNQILSTESSTETLSNWATAAWTTSKPSALTSTKLTWTNPQNPLKGVFGNFVVKAISHVVQPLSVTTADGISIQLLTNGPSRGNTGGSVFGRIKDGTLSYEAGSWARCFLFVLSRIGTSRSSPVASALGCWNNEIPVPWKASLAKEELGLWSILSTAAVVNTFFLSLGDQTTPSDS